MRRHGRQTIAIGIAAFAAAASIDAFASSHREAPFITQLPKVDGTDFYMFRSYESGRSDYVTLIANYQPLQEPGGGPNYYTMDPDAIYEIHVDNNGDAIEDITFRFDFEKIVRGLTVPVGDQQVAVPLKQIGQLSASGDDSEVLNIFETYTVDVVRGDRRTGTASRVVNMEGGADSFRKPVDNIGRKTIGDYEDYASQFVYDVTIPGCNNPGRVFVGQRQESFVANLGETFDLVNYDPVAARDSQTSTLNRYNITSLAVEVHRDCLTTGGSPIIGGWTAASLPQARVLNPNPVNDEQPAIHGGAYTQVSRLGNPLVNELVIGVPDKDLFNTSEPQNDTQFLNYVTHPSFPIILETLFPVTAPDSYPREDLVSVFLTGVPDLNQPPNVVPAEMLRLNTGIDPVPAASQNTLGVLGGDTAGFPNGRRPSDDVVDIALRVLMGALIDPDNTPPFTDGALPDPMRYLERFPYISVAIPGSPSEANDNFDAESGGDSQ
jgi:hypothetical protein